MEKNFLPLHFASLTYVAWNVLHADHMGFKWIRGTIPTLDEKKVRKYHYGTWIGLGLMITTGSLLFLQSYKYLLTRPQFYVKMGFVVALIINGFILGSLQKTAINKSYASLSIIEKIPLFLSGGASTLCWLGAMAGEYFLFP